MSINIQAKTNVSYLFSSLGNGASGVAGSNFLADYASIKNGEYTKYSSVPDTSIGRKISRSQLLPISSEVPLTFIAPLFQGGNQ